MTILGQTFTRDVVENPLKFIRQIELVLLVVAAWRRNLKLLSPGVSPVKGSLLFKTTDSLMNVK